MRLGNRTYRPGNRTNPVNLVLLKGIVEADETYIGGKPRKTNKREDQKPSKRGRGTSKNAILGAVERGSKVVAQLTADVTGRTILEFIRKVVKVEETTLVTDEFPFSVFISQTCVVPTLSKQFQVNRKKRQMENRILIHNSKSPLSCANPFVTRVCRKNTKMCQNKYGV